MNPYLTFTIACYAAFVSSLVLAWDIAKWRRSRPHLKIELDRHAHPAGGEENKWTTITITNLGAQATTIKKVSLAHRVKGRLILEQEDFRFRNKISLPVILEPGNQWVGHPMHVDATFTTQPKAGDYLVVFHSMGEKPARLKIKPGFPLSYP